MIKSLENNISNSPFIIEQNLLSPSLCEDVIQFIDLDLMSSSYKEDIELVIFEHIQNILPNFEQYYSVNYKQISNIDFEDLYQGYKSKSSISDNSLFINGKWTRIHDIDFTGIIFLSDFNNKPPFSKSFEVYGGKLEFPQHKFGFNPERGTLIMFPSDPHFHYNFSDVQVGKSYYIKFNITCTNEFVYNRNNFKGNYLTWFQTIG